MTRSRAIASTPFRRACHPLLLAAVAFACDPSRAAPAAGLNLVPPPLPVRLIPPPPYALESGVVTNIAALWRRDGGLWEPGMNVLVPDARAARGMPFAAPEPATARPAWSLQPNVCPAMGDERPAGAPEAGAGR